MALVCWLMGWFDRWVGFLFLFGGWLWSVDSLALVGWLVGWLCSGGCFWLVGSSGESIRYFYIILYY